jgi:signal transduction histidine kinase
MSSRDDRAGGARLLIPYWIRAVHIGLESTAIVLVTLVTVPLLPHDFVVHGPLYAGVIVGAAIGAAVVLLLPWRRLFERGPWGIRLMYCWSVADILLVSVGVVATGGGRSPLFFVYALTTVFFGAAYPARSQAALTAFTMAAYLGALAIGGWHVSGATLALQMTVLATLTLLTSFMFGELVERVGAEDESRRTAERWAELLSTVAATIKEMNLDEDSVLNVTIAGVRRLGFHGAAINRLDDDGQRFRAVRALGLPKEFVDGVFPTSQGLTPRVLEEQGTVTTEDYGSVEDGIPAIRDAGFGTVVLTPVWVGGVLTYTLWAGYRDRRALQTQEVEAIQMLAQHAGLALENAHRFEEEHRMVQRLAELDRMKSDFLATISHELRTPVTVIRGVGATLERVWGNVDELTMGQMLTGLSQNARALEEVVTSLLDFSRMESGVTEVSMQPVDLRHVVEAAVAHAVEAMGRPPVAMDIRPGIRASADPTLLERVVGHLLQNAVRHTPPGTPIRVETRVDGGAAVVSVIDRGQGITPEELPHLTERFFRGGDINTRPRGLGLGLALVSEMVATMGSRLEIDSAPGWGSRFGFRLELIEDVAAGRPSKRSAPRPRPRIRAAQTAPGPHSGSRTGPA